MNEQAKYRVTNWPEYNAALKQRGSLTVWIEDGFEKVWYDFSDSRKKGRPLLYLDICVKLVPSTCWSRVNGIVLFSFFRRKGGGY